MPGIKDTRGSLGDGTCKDIYCSQPCTIVGVNRSVPAVEHHMLKGGFIISWDSIYGDLCYFHDKIARGLISGVVHRRKSQIR